MASTVDMATIEDDQRHVPGPDSLPLWNESFWFAFYDPRIEVGVTVRLGMFANQEEANIYLFLVHRDEVVHSLIDLRAPVPSQEAHRLRIAGMEIEWKESLGSFRLRYEHDAHGMDVVWKGYSPTYLYPSQNGADQEPGQPRVAGHIEHGGVVTGTITLAGKQYAVDCLGHRDHSWGGERDWAKLHHWDYLSGEIDKDFWFNTVRVVIGEGAPEIFIGGLWDGKELLNLNEVRMEVRTADDGARQLRVDLYLVGERKREHHIVGEEVFVVAVTQFGRTWCKDGFIRYRYGDRVGYGIQELGYVERP